MGATLSGLLGVLVGALLSGAGALLASHRLDKRQTRVSARLIEAELEATSRSLLRLTVGAEAMVHGSPDPSKQARYALQQLAGVPTTSIWDDHKALLAGVLDSEDWYALRRAYENLAILRSATSHHDELFEWGQYSFGAKFLAELLVELANDVAAGAEAVSRLAENPLPPPSPDPFREALVKVLGTGWANRRTASKTLDNGDATPLDEPLG